MSYEKLTEQEQYWKQQFDEMLRRAGEIDEAEGRDEQQLCTALPAGLDRAQSRLKRLEQAKRELEQEAQQQLEEAQRAWSSREKRGRPRKEKSHGSTQKSAARKRSDITEHCAT